MRLDKWLWCARFYKTRALAAEAVKSGKVQLGGRPVKPGHVVRAGDELRIRTGALVAVITLLQLVPNRQSAAGAALLYRESEASIAAREQFAAQLKAERQMYPRSAGRPTKRDRRDLMKFKRPAPE
jgi:ribosome-associated heat shock protein Hsp15